MSDDIRNIVLGVVAAGISASLGWLARTYLWRRRLRRKQAFFGLPGNSECLLVVNREAGSDGAVHRYDVSALLELAALIKDCGAHAEIVQHDTARQGFGERTEFCLGGPYSNRRMAAHLTSLLPGVKVDTSTESGPDRGSFQIGSERYRAEGASPSTSCWRGSPSGRGRGRSSSSAASGPSPTRRPRAICTATTRSWRASTAATRSVCC